MAFEPKPHLIQLPRRTKDRTTGQYVTQYDDYLEVKWRVVMFREKYPHGSIITEEICVDLDKGYARYKAHVGDGEGGMATVYGTETVKDFADFAERAETRAVGRALALLGFGTQFVGADLTEGEHVADAPVAPPQHPATEPAPEPVEERLSQEAVDHLWQVAKAVNEPKDAFARRIRQLMQLPGSQLISKTYLRQAMSIEQYRAAVAYYEQQLKNAVEEDVPDHPPPSDGGSSTSAGGEPAAEPVSASTPAEDQAAKDREIVRALAMTWGLPAVEVDHVLNHHKDPQKARDILWRVKQQRDQKPDPQPSLTAAD